MTDDTAPLWNVREDVDLSELERAWGESKLSEVLAATLNSYNRLGRVNAGTAAYNLGVSTGTIRRWVRDGVPAARRGDVIGLVRPPQGAFTQERTDHLNARWALTKIADEPANAEGLWGYKGWLNPHDLAIIAIDDMPVHTIRLSATDRSKDSNRRLTAGGKIVSIVTFPNYFAAVRARAEILEDVYAFRVQLRNTHLASGAGKAWLADAPHKPLASYRKKPRKQVRPLPGTTDKEVTR